MEYRLKDITPEGMCLLGACPSIYADREGNYLIIGERVNPREVGLEEKVAEGEILVRVPQKLIDEKKA